MAKSKRPTRKGQPRPSRSRHKFKDVAPELLEGFEAGPAGAVDLLRAIVRTGKGTVPEAPEPLGPISNKEYRAMLKALKADGVYAPKSEKLTPYRKKMIRRKAEEIRPFIEKDPSTGKPAFTFIKAPKGADKSLRYMRGRSDEQVTFTRTGAFISTKGRSGIPLTKARFTKNKRTGFWEVEGVLERTAQKLKPGQKRQITFRRFLTPPSELAKSIARVRSDAERVKRSLRRGQRMTFVIYGKSISRTNFGTVDELYRYLTKYRFFQDEDEEGIDSIEIVKVEHDWYSRPGDEYRSLVRERYPNIFED